MSKFEKIGAYTIYFDQIYYLAYAGGHRELTKDKQKAWDRTLGLPELLKIKEQHKLSLECNPNVVPLTGEALLGFIRDLKFVPFFDRAFNNTHLVKLTDVIIYESIKQKSYDIALKN